MRKIVDITGKRFGRLAVVSYHGCTPNGGAHFKCRCDCGAEKIVRSKSLRCGDTLSCGCLQREVQAVRLTKHGKARTPEYGVWRDMRHRCRNPRYKQYKDYGGRGIRVCKRWDSFANFLADMGPRPDASLTIERKNNNGHYTPGNCCWATRLAQVHNRRKKQPAAT